MVDVGSIWWKRIYEGFVLPACCCCWYVRGFTWNLDGGLLRLLLMYIWTFAFVAAVAPCARMEVFRPQFYCRCTEGNVLSLLFVLVSVHVAFFLYGRCHSRRSCIVPFFVGAVHIDVVVVGVVEIVVVVFAVVCCDCCCRCLMMLPVCSKHCCCRHWCWQCRSACRWSCLQVLIECCCRRRTCVFLVCGLSLKHVAVLNIDRCRSDKALLLLRCHCSILLLLNYEANVVVVVLQRPILLPLLLLLPLQG